MTRRLIIRPDAEVDITQAAMWYEHRENGLGDEVVSEIRSAINRALATPDAYLRLRDHPRVHRVLVHRFPYRVFYLLAEDALVVFAVVHAARHDQSWGHRVPLNSS